MSFLRRSAPERVAVPASRRNAPKEITINGRTVRVAGVIEENGKPGLIVDDNGRTRVIPLGGSR